MWDVEGLSAESMDAMEDVSGGAEPGKLLTFLRLAFGCEAVQLREAESLAEAGAELEVAEEADADPSDRRARGAVISNPAAMASISSSSRVLFLLA